MPTLADILTRQFAYSLINPVKTHAILDLGCNAGYDLQQIGRLVPDATRLVGIDILEKAIEAANAETIGDDRFTFLTADISAPLPFEDASFDVVFSKNVLECIPDKDAHIKEIHRVLRPGGQIVCAHYDWDSQLIDGDDKALIRKIVHTFADWKQAWMTDCDPWMGRRLWRTFQQSALFQGSVHAQVLTETDYIPSAYGYQSIQSFQALTRRGMITPEEFNTFKASIEALAEKDQYFYSITMCIYSGVANPGT